MKVEEGFKKGVQNENELPWHFLSVFFREEETTCWQTTTTKDDLKLCSAYLCLIHISVSLNDLSVFDLLNAGNKYRNKKTEIHFNYWKINFTFLDIIKVFSA